MIEVEHLTKSYGAGLAVNDISFTVNKGEILGFLGPNGAGKTTTMRILTGYLPATGGTARVAGFDVFDDSMEVRQRIGYLPETPPLYPEMDVTNYLKFVARIKGVASSDLDRRVDTAMSLTGLTERRSELIKRLSRGYKQRVGIAQAIVHNPDVVILDEPTIGLDPNQIIEVRKLIKGLAGEHTVILSTHILPEVEMTCDRVVIINKGKIAAIDTPKNLTTQRKGSERVIVQVRGQARGDATNDIDDIKAKLDEIEGVSAVTLGESPNEETVAITVESEQGTDLRGKIAAQLVNGGFELLELRAVSISLEDTFRQLTTEETSTTDNRQPTTDNL